MLRLAILPAMLVVASGCTCGGGPGLGTSTPLTGVVEIAAGGFHTCARTEAGEIFCWGMNNEQQVGVGSAESTVLRPTRLATLTNVKQLALGHQHTCALLETGTFMCWGDNAGAQLGDGTTTDHGQPMHVEGLRRVEEISLGSMRTCARTQEGTVWCVGVIESGAREGAREPTQVPGLLDVAELDVGTTHACVRHQTGTVSCWGQNLRGELGDGTTVDHPQPVSVAGLEGVAEITVGDRRSCARMNDGTVRCWGYGGGGALGTGGSGDEVRTPTPVAGLAEVAEIDGGEAHLCARRTDGTVWCWGDRFYAQIGDGRSGHGEDRGVTRPVAVPGIGGATQIATGRRHTCALLTDETVTCWGDNTGGAIGDGTRQQRASPTAVH